MTKSRHILRPRRAWTPDEDQCLRDWYPWVLSQTLADTLGRPVGSVHQRSNTLGLYKDRGTIAELARERSGPDHPSVGYRWPKGHVPANKGLRRPGYARGNMAATMFKPGNRPWTWVPVGSIRVGGDGLLEIKYSDDPGPPKARWIAYHRYLWEDSHGPVPPDRVVVFKPGRRTVDPAQITLDALECISRAELMARNTVHRYPPEIAQLVQLRGALNRRINAKAKEAA